MNDPGLCSFFSVSHNLMPLMKFNLLSISRLPSSEFLPLTSWSAPRRDGFALGREPPFLVLEHGPNASYIRLLPLHFLSPPSHSFLPFPWKISRKSRANNWETLTESELREGKGLKRRDQPSAFSGDSVGRLVSWAERASSLKRPLILHFPRQLK